MKNKRNKSDFILLNPPPKEIELERPTLNFLLNSSPKEIKLARTTIKRKKLRKRKKPVRKSVKLSKLVK